MGETKLSENVLKYTKENVAFGELKENIPHTRCCILSIILQLTESTLRCIPILVEVNYSFKSYILNIRRRGAN